MDQTHKRKNNAGSPSTFGRMSNKLTLLTFAALTTATLTLIPTAQLQASTSSKVTVPFSYSFSADAVINETGSIDLSSSPYWWVSKGGQLIVKSGNGQSLQGITPTTNPWNSTYEKINPAETDKGTHPQNIFSMFLRQPLQNSDESVSLKINADNLSNTANRNPWNGILLTSRWQNDNNYYYAGLRADGHVIVKKKVNGTYYTLAEKALLPGTWNATTNPNLIPKNTWFSLRNVTYTDTNGAVHIQLYTDMNQSGVWKLALDTIDNGTNGATIKSQGLSGFRSDFMDTSFDNYELNSPDAIISSSTISTPTSTPTTTPTSTQPSTSSNVLFSDPFSQYSDGLITNEYAFWNKTSSNSKQSANWELDSGSLFASGGAGWTGIPNDISPNALSTNGNNSSIFRLVTKQSNFGDVTVNFDLLNQGLNSSASTPKVSWDGVHIFLRYQSEYNLYYASVNRRDNTVVIKKKVPGGPSNNGTYYELSKYTAHTVPYNAWQNITATVKNNTDGTVTIELYANGTLLTRAVDNGTIGGAPIRNAGRVGMRGDNANLKIKNFKVSSL